MKEILKAGTFIKNRNSFKIDTYTFYVKERKGATVKKPKNFLVAVKPKFQYISSLYEDKKRPNYYLIDFNNKEYYLKMTDDEVTILNKE